MSINYNTAIRVPQMQKAAFCEVCRYYRDPCNFRFKEGSLPKDICYCCNLKKPTKTPEGTFILKNAESKKLQYLRYDGYNTMKGHMATPQSKWLAIKRKTRRESSSEFYLAKLVYRRITY